MKIVVLGLSVTSSWGNGHAATYRALLRGLAGRGHEILFLERDAPWYAENRDAPELPYASIALYDSLAQLQARHLPEIRRADAVLIGSYVPEGVAVGEWLLQHAQGLVAFYDLDTPVTLARLKRGDCDYITPELIRRYPLYLSFTGGPTLKRLETEYVSPLARPLYCGVDPEAYAPEGGPVKWDLGYLGTYGADRQPTLDRLLVQPANAWPTGRFLVAGAQYPDTLRWPGNVQRVEHVPPARHRRFYNDQRFTLNITRADMVSAGYSPSVRLFEAAACGTPIISDEWPGLDSFFAVGSEILIARDAEEMLHYLHDVAPARSRSIGEAARARVLAQHTAAHRAAELEGHFQTALGRSETRAGHLSPA